MTGWSAFTRPLATSTPMAIAPTRDFIEHRGLHGGAGFRAAITVWQKHVSPGAFIPFAAIKRAIATCGVDVVTDLIEHLGAAGELNEARFRDRIFGLLKREGR